MKYLTEEEHQIHIIAGQLKAKCEAKKEELNKSEEAFENGLISPIERNAIWKIYREANDIWVKYLYEHGDVLLPKVL